MRIAPVSADLLIKLAVAASVVGAVWYVTRQAKQYVSDAVDNVLGTVDATWEAVRPDAIIEAVTSAADYLTTPDPTHRETGFDGTSQYVLSKDR